MYDTILQMIPNDNQKRITSSQISQQLNIKGSEVRKYINQMRSSGIPVCSDIKGYYISMDEENVRAQIASMENRISAMKNAIGGLNQFLTGKLTYVN